MTSNEIRDGFKRDWRLLKMRLDMTLKENKDDFKNILQSVEIRLYKYLVVSGETNQINREMNF